MSVIRRWCLFTMLNHLWGSRGSWIVCHWSKLWLLLGFWSRCRWRRSRKRQSSTICLTKRRLGRLRDNRGLSRCLLAWCGHCNTLQALNNWIWCFHMGWRDGRRFPSNQSLLLRKIATNGREELQGIGTFPKINIQRMQFIHVSLLVARIIGGKVPVCIAGDRTTTEVRIHDQGDDIGMIVGIVDSNSIKIYPYQIAQ